MGGATPVIFSAEVADFVARTHLEFSQKLAGLSVRYVRVLPEVTVNESALCRSWKETYNAVTKEEAEAAMHKQGPAFRWLPDGDCRTTTLPTIRKDPARASRSSSIQSSRLSLAGTMHATGVVRRWSSVMVRPWMV